MIYSNLVAGKNFLPVRTDLSHMWNWEGQPVVCHVKNTGRCRELLRPGATVYLQDFGPSPTGRKTRYDLIAVEKVRVDGSKLLINMDAQAPNQVFAEWGPQRTLSPKSDPFTSRNQVGVFPLRFLLRDHPRTMRFCGGQRGSL